MKIVAEFELEKTTKNTVRYSEVAEEGRPPTIGTIYLQKWALDPNPQNKLTVTIVSS